MSAFKRIFQMIVKIGVVRLIGVDPNLEMEKQPRLVETVLYN